VIYTWKQTEENIILDFYRCPKDEEKAVVELKGRVLYLSFLSTHGSDFEYSLYLYDDV